MKHFFRTLFAAVLLLGFANIELNAAPPLSIIQKVKDQVEAARYQLPVKAGMNLILTQVSYDSQTYSIVYRYHFTVPTTKPTSSTIKEAKLGIIHLIKANPNSEEMQFLKSGITFHYNYYTTDGTFLYAVKITPSDVR